MNAWPPLPPEDWVDTRKTVHLWTQVLGKLTLAASPFVNQWWSVGLQLTAHGLNTGLVPVGDRRIEGMQIQPDAATLEVINERHRTRIVGPPLPAAPAPQVG